MAFIRLKKVAGKHYAYLVENTWSSKGPRQSVAKYLGKYVQLEDAPPLLAESETGKLIAAELRARGFSEKLAKEKMKVNLQTCTVREGKKRIVLGLNGGFLCDYTLRRLLHFQPVEEVTPGYKLARSFSDAGVRISREQFVHIYKKLYTRHATH